jgi:hypothetical protein
LALQLLLLRRVRLVFAQIDSGRSLRRFENVGSVIAMAYQVILRVTLACWQSL